MSVVLVASFYVLHAGPDRCGPARFMALVQVLVGVVYLII